VRDTERDRQKDRQETDRESVSGSHHTPRIFQRDSVGWLLQPQQIEQNQNRVAEIKSFQLSLLNSTFAEETTEQKTNQKKDRHRHKETWLSVDSKNRSKGLKTITLDWSRWNQLSATTAA
jgi:hypothetical protein